MSRLHELGRLGQSVWIDFLARDFLEDRGLERMLHDDAVVGVTSNPTIFQKAMAKGSAYDPQLRELVRRAKDARDPRVIFQELMARDVARACDVLAPVWRTTHHRDGWVSIEVDPAHAHDRAEQSAETVRLREMVDRPNVLVKIPATDEGVGAIEDAIAAGRSINVTLIFSVERYQQVAEAYLRGLERLVEHGGDPSDVASVASFFVSRVDSEIDARLEKLGTEEALGLRGRAAIANAKLAYQRFEKIFSGERWDVLAARGAKKQRCLWASTSTKNPSYRDVVYVEELIGPETVSTMPSETIEAFQDHGRVAPTLKTGLADARRVFDDLARVGVDVPDAMRTLEREGIEKFTKSIDEAYRGIAAKVRALSTDGAGAPISVSPR